MTDTLYLEQRRSYGASLDQDVRAFVRTNRPPLFHSGIRPRVLSSLVLRYLLYKPGRPVPG